MARVSRSRFLDQPCKHIAAALLATTLVLVGSAFVLTNSAQAVTGTSTRGRPNESAMTCPIGATCYYFAAGGNDSAGAGTLASPWQSVAKAMSKLASLKPGDELLFKGGDSWTQTFTFGDSPTHAVVGTAAAPIVVGSYGTGRAIFDENNTNGYCF